MKNWLAIVWASLPHHERRRHEHFREAVMCFLTHQNGVTSNMNTLLIGNLNAVALAFVDANGNPTSAPTFNDNGPLVWTVGDPTIATIEVAEDGLSASISALSPGTLSLAASGTDDNGVAYSITGTATVVAAASAPPPPPGVAASASMVFTSTAPAAS